MLLLILIPHNHTHTHSKQCAPLRLLGLYGPYLLEGEAAIILLPLLSLQGLDILAEHVFQHLDVDLMNVRKQGRMQVTRMMFLNSYNHQSNAKQGPAFKSPPTLCGPSLV